VFIGCDSFICLAARTALPVTLKKLLAKLSLRRRAALAAARSSLAGRSIDM